MQVLLVTARKRLHFVAETFSWANRRPSILQELGQSVADLIKKIPDGIQLALKTLKLDISGLLTIFGKIANLGGFAGVMQTYEEYEELQDHFVNGMGTALGLVSRA